METRSRVLVWIRPRKPRGEIMRKKKVKKKKNIKKYLSPKGVVSCVPRSHTIRFATKSQNIPFLYLPKSLITPFSSAFFLVPTFVLVYRLFSPTFFAAVWQWDLQRNRRSQRCRINWTPVHQTIIEGRIATGREETRAPPTQPYHDRRAIGKLHPERLLRAS